MVILSNVNLARVTRRISSGDNGAPMNPPLTAAEIQAGGRLDDFWVASANGDDDHAYQWTFSVGTTKAQAKASVKAWFVAGKPTTMTAPMLSAIDTSPAESWDTTA
jgi:hypothetical protein